VLSLFPLVLSLSKPVLSEVEGHEDTFPLRAFWDTLPRRDPTARSAQPVSLANSSGSSSSCLIRFTARAQ